MAQIESEVSAGFVPFVQIIHVCHVLKTIRVCHVLKTIRVCHVLKTIRVCHVLKTIRVRMSRVENHTYTYVTC